MSVSSHGQLTAVPIAVQGNNVSIVPGNMNTQFIKASPQSIRPAGATGQIMLQVQISRSAIGNYIFGELSRQPVLPLIQHISCASLCFCVLIV